MRGPSFREMTANVCIAKILAPHGIRGEVKLASYATKPLTAYGLLVDSSGKVFKIKSVKGSGDKLTATFEGIATREAAEALKGKELYAKRNALPDTRPNEFYHADLIGLKAIVKDGAAYGTVLAVHDFGAGAILEIDLANGGSEMLPFNNAFVPEVDLESKTLTIIPPEYMVAEDE